MKRKRPISGQFVRMPSQWKEVEVPTNFLVDFARGGFVGLEEVDPSDPALQDILPNSSEIQPKRDQPLVQSSRAKKRPRRNDGNDIGLQDTPKSNQSEVVISSKKKSRSRDSSPKLEIVTNNRESSELDVVEDVNIEEVAPEPSALTLEALQTYEPSAWSQYAIHPAIERALLELNFQTPTTIQSLVLPHAVSYRKDIVASSETGSGKTLAFGIPIVHFLASRTNSGRNVHLPALIVTPTRELAIQIVSHLRLICKYLPLRIVSIVGGLAMPKQLRLLSLCPDIVVATPGRLWDLLQHGNVEYLKDLRPLEFLVLDEADRMIQHGHFADLEHILACITKLEDGNEVPAQSKRQSFVVSATMTVSDDVRARQKKKRVKQVQKSDASSGTFERILDLVHFQRKIEIVQASGLKPMPLTLRETMVSCPEAQKDKYLYSFLASTTGQTIVFVNAISSIKRIVPLFELLRFPIWGIHANMPQRQRLKNLDRFRSTPSGIIVATDVLARGIDIPEVDNVVHYHAPESAEVYIHRCGRTARAKRNGLSLALIDPSQHQLFRRISYALANDEIEVYPVLYALFRPIEARLSLALKITRAQAKAHKETSSASWVKRAANEMDISLSDDEDSDDQSKNQIQKQHQTQIRQWKQELAALLARPLEEPKPFRKVVSKSRRR